MNKSISRTGNEPASTVAQQLAKAAIAFEERLTGHTPKSVTVVLSDSTLVITLHGALSPAEEALAKTPGGASRVQEFHRELFNNSFDSLRDEIKRITGVEVREVTAEVEASTGTVVKAFTSGTVVQVFLLSGSVPMDAWSGDGAAIHFEREPDGQKILGRIENDGRSRSL